MLDPEIVATLAEEVKGSEHFHERKDQRDKLSKTLDEFVRAYSTKSQPAPERITAHARHTLKDHLKQCFRNDLSFWADPRQYALEIPNAPHGLSPSLLSKVIEDAPTRFWFHQCARMKSYETLIVFSEPLFFHLKGVNAYLRLLEIDHNQPLHGTESHLSKQAKTYLANKFGRSGLDPQAIKVLSDWLDPVPVRHYVPAGDAYAASAIRRWFRTGTQLKSPPKAPSRRESQRVTTLDYDRYNLIVLASRSTNKELSYFRDKNPNLRLDLIEKGIRFDGQELPDEMPDAPGEILAHVIVTNWVLDSERVYTSIASNFSRAVGRVAQYLVSSDMEAKKLVTSEGIIPRKMQIAFEVKLAPGEFQARSIKRIGDPIFYDTVTPAPKTLSTSHG